VGMMLLHRNYYFEKIAMKKMGIELALLFEVLHWEQFSAL
jgi:hypothetical protein